MTSDEDNQGSEQDDHKWLEPKDVAVYLGIKKSKVYEYMGRAIPPWPFYRVTPTKRLTKKSDLDAWLEKVKVPAVMPDQSHGRRN